MSQQTSNNMSRNNSRNTIPFVEADMDNGCESGACGLAKTFYESQCRLLWRLKTRGELSTFYRSTFESWAPEEVKSSPGLRRQFAQVMFALVNDGQILRVNKGQYLVWTDPQNPANRRRNQGPQRNNHHGHQGHRRDQQGPRRDHQGPYRGHQGPIVAVRGLPGFAKKVMSALEGNLWTIIGIHRLSASSREVLLTVRLRSLLHATGVHQHLIAVTPIKY